MGIQFKCRCIVITSGHFVIESCHALTNPAICKNSCFEGCMLPFCNLPYLFLRTSQHRHKEGRLFLLHFAFQKRTLRNCRWFHKVNLTFPISEQKPS